MKQLKNQRGLTLVELLAVIVILAIIAAIAAVAIGNVINNTKDKGILSDATHIIEGAKIAHLDGACSGTVHTDGTAATGAKGTETCTASDLATFIETAKLKNDDKTTGYSVQVYEAPNTGAVTYAVSYDAFEKIKNDNYKKVGTPQVELKADQQISEQDLHGLLGGKNVN